MMSALATVGSPSSIHLYLVLRLCKYSSFVLLNLLCFRIEVVHSLYFNCLRCWIRTISSSRFRSHLMRTKVFMVRGEGGGGKLPMKVSTYFTSKTLNSTYLNQLVEFVVEVVIQCLLKFYNWYRPLHFVQKWKKKYFFIFYGSVTVLR